ncbi:unnamed protein product, partial [Rotaria magnacalcarata]
MMTSKDAETRPLTNLYSENNIIETAKKKSTSSKISKKKAKAEKKEADMDDLKKELDIHIESLESSWNILMSEPCRYFDFHVEFSDHHNARIMSDNILHVSNIENQPPKDEYKNTELLKEQLRQSEEDNSKLKEQNKNSTDLIKKLWADIQNLRSYVDTLKQKVTELENKLEQKCQGEYGQDDSSSSPPL